MPTVGWHIEVEFEKRGTATEISAVTHQPASVEV